MSLEEGRRAPSLSFYYNDNEQGDILVQDVHVPAAGLTKNTYYCCLHWNGGQQGGGYCGIQDHPRGRNYIFSIWDPIGTSEPIKPVYVGPGTKCERFGGEGTGLKSWNFEQNWTPDTWYTFVVRRWDKDSHTHFGLWVKDHNLQLWTHIITMDFPVPNVYFQGATCSFLEDWHGSGEHVRRVHFRNGYKRSVSKEWIGFNMAIFGVVREASSRLYENNFDAGILNDGIFLQSGGKSSHNTELVEGRQFEMIVSEMPDKITTDFEIQLKNSKALSWDIPADNPPQFRYWVRTCVNDIDSEKKDLDLNEVTANKQIELSIENIFGELTKKSIN